MAVVCRVGRLNVERGTTTVDFFRYVGSDCTTQPDGYATVCTADYTDDCGPTGGGRWVGCTDPFSNFQNGHWVKAIVRFDDVVPGFTWTDAKRQEVACHELGHVLGVWHAEGSCLETVDTGNYTAPTAHDYEQANSNHNHTDCIPPCPQRSDETVIVHGPAIPLTVQELLLRDLGTPWFLIPLLVH